MINTINKSFYKAANLGISCQPACKVMAQSHSVPAGKSNPSNSKTQIILILLAFNELRPAFTKCLWKRIATNVNEVSDFFNSATAGVTDEAIHKALTIMWGYALNGMNCSLGWIAT